MEDIRRRFAGEGLYPVLGKQKPASTSRHRTPEVIVLSSDSEGESARPSSSRAAPPVKSAPRKNPRVIESSDEEDEDEQPQNQSREVTASEEEDEDEDEDEDDDDDEVEELVAAAPSNQARGRDVPEPVRASASSAPAFPIPKPYQPPQGTGAPVPAPMQMPRPEHIGYRPHNVTAGQTQPQLSQYDAYHAKYSGQPVPAQPGFPKPPVPLAKPHGYPPDAKTRLPAVAPMSMEQARFGPGPEMKPRAPSNFIASAPNPYDQIRGELESRNAPRSNGGQDFSHLLNVDHIREDFVTQDEAQKQVLELVANAVHHDDVEINPEDAIVEGFTDGIKLLPHQIVGRKFMAERESGKGKLGGILADDMGLGKTIQALTRIVDNKPSREDREKWSRATLVVCPASLVTQWADEIKQKTVGLKVLEHQGVGRPRDAKVFNNYHVVVTTYQTLASEYSNSLGGADLDDDDEEGGTKSKGKSKAKAKEKQKNADRGEDSDDDFSKYLQKSKDTKSAKGKPKAKPKHEALFNTNWWRVVLDEAHNIKNRSSKQSVACWHLDAKYRWALTGTPIQNDVEDLFAIFRFLRVKPLHEWSTFKEIIAAPIKAGRTKRAMARIHTILRAIMLRRTKATEMDGKRLIELPDRNIQQVTCEFDDGERAFYRSLEDKTAKIFEDMEKTGAVMKNYTSVLVMLLRLRQTCDHPVLVSKDYTGDLADSFADGGKKDDADALAEVFGDLHVGSNKCSVCQTELTSSDRGATCSDCSLILAMEKRRHSGGVPSRTSGGSANAGPSSAKLRKMVELLQQIDEESDSSDKTIIFSQFTGMLDLVENFLKAEGTRFTRFDGTMSKEQKAAAVQKIKESRTTRVILISLKAGGVGLNLTACNRVILLDPWWNPAIEEQAFDRAHRFGQKKTVEVYKLTVQDTVEQRIIEMQDKKRELAAAALSGQKVNANKLTISDLRKLFSRHHDHEESDDD